MNIAADAMSAGTPEPKTLRVMLDLETLGTTAKAHVLSIGWALFDDTRVVSSGHVNVRHDEQESRERSFGTTSWWVRQGMDNPEAARAWMYPGVTYAPEHALKVLTWAIHSAGGGAEVWANSPTFDCAILHDMYKQYLSEEAPWAFYQERDFLTFKASARNAFLPQSGSTAHTAEGDAIAQAQFMLASERQQNSLAEARDLQLRLAASVLADDRKAALARQAKRDKAAAAKAARVKIDKRKPKPKEGWKKAAKLPAKKR